METKFQKRLRRKKRIRSKVFGTKNRPRLSVFRSNKHLYAQIIDDEKNVTLVAMSDMGLNKDIKKANHTTKKIAKTKFAKSKIESRKMLNLKKYSGIEKARLVGELLAKKAMEKKIKRIVFDRGGYRYHGYIKALAEGARKGGLKF